jgi:signal transduction histidine kinase/CheY-like chemotaxis protein
MASKEDFPSLRQVFSRLLLFRLFLPLLVLGLTAIVGVGYLEEIKLEIQQYQIAHSMAQIVDHHLDQGGRIMDALARVAETSGTENLSLYMKSTWEAYGYFETLYYLDEDNKVNMLVPSDPRYLGLDMSNLPDFKQIGEKKSLIISRPFISLRTGEPTVYLVKALKRGGCVAGELNLGLFQIEIMNINRTSGMDFIFIMDQDGTLLAHPSPDLVKQQTNLSNLEIFQRGLAEKGNVVYMSNGTWVLGSAALVDRTGWVVVNQVPWSIFWGSYVWILGLILLVSLTIWLILVWNLRKQLQRYVGTPLEQLSRETNALTVGDFSQVNSLSSIPTPSAELSKLVNDFQSMSTSLQERETALRTIAQELSEADHRKNEFLGVLSHELRNPLASIQSSLALLDRSTPGGEQAKKAKDVIKRQISQLSRMVDDLLDITRITQNKIKLQKQTFELNKLVRRTLEDYYLLFSQKKVCLEAEYAPSEIMVNVDETRLTQVVGNLLHNAVKFTNSGGTTRVCIESDNLHKQAVIRITDSGTGIEPEMLSRIFQPFMQADMALDRGHGGLGLGLALVKGLVEMHGGNVNVFSAGPGKGSEFSVRIPFADAIIEKPQETVNLEISKCTHSVLIIDDNADIAEILSELLKSIGYTVEVAYNGPEGIVKAREFKPEILLCDIGLPGMNGYDVAKAFRSDQGLKDIFLIALTGYALPEDIQKAFNAGFDRHLAKPVQLEILEQTLAQAPEKTLAG